MGMEDGSARRLPTPMAASAADEPMDTPLSPKRPRANDAPDQVRAG